MSAIVRPRGAAPAPAFFVFSQAAILAAFLVALLTYSTPVAAQAAREPARPEFKPRIGQVAPGGCAQGACDWVSIESADYLGASEKGWLMRLETRWWRSVHPDGYQRRAPRKPAGDRTFHVFCSKMEPALIASPDGAAGKTQEGMWPATMLAPGNRAFATGPAESLVALYWLACHDAVVEDVSREGTALARRLGYGSAPLRGPAERPLADPLDALRW